MKAANSPRNPFQFVGIRFLVLILVMIAILIADTIIARTAVFVSDDLLSSWRVAAFLGILATCGIGQYLILRYVVTKSRAVRTKKNLHIGTMHKGITMAQYVLIGILIFTFLQMTIAHSYSTALISTITAISYAMAAVILSSLSWLFFSWYRSDRNRIILSYGISSLLLVANVMTTALFALVIVQDKPSEVVPRVGIQIPITQLGSGTVKDALNQAYLACSMASFIMLWIATTILLRDQYKKLGIIRFWVMFTIPLAYFLSQFIALFVNFLQPIVELDPVSVSIFLSLAFWLSKPLGGILFGLVFWLMSKNVDNRTVKDYMVISGCGLAFVFLSNQAVTIAATPTYPPFGLATISFLGVSSYLFMLGIYSSAISVSHDMKLRTSIQRFTLSKIKLLQSFSAAEWKLRVESEVKEMVKKNCDTMAENTGVQPSITEQDLKKYLEEVLSEVKKKNQSQPA